MPGNHLKVYTPSGKRMEPHPQDVTNVIPANAADAHDKLNSMNKDGDIEGLCTNALGMPKHSMLDSHFHTI